MDATRNPMRARCALLVFVLLGWDASANDGADDYCVLLRSSLIRLLGEFGD